MTTRNRRSGRNVRRRPRQPPRNNRRKTRRPSRAVLPPATTLYGHIMRSVVQTAWDIAQGALKGPIVYPDCGIIHKVTPNGTSWNAVDIDNGWLLAQGWLDRFKGLFNEIKVHSITAHYMPYESITSPGEYVMALWDYNQDTTPNSFAEALGMPASVVRKNGQPSRLTWYPTEPDDRNWMLLSSPHKWCSCVLFEAESVYNVSVPTDPSANTPRGEIAGVQGKIIIELDASFRGKPKKPTVNGRDSPAASEEFKQYQRDNPCLCRKCLPGLLKSIRFKMSEFDSHPGSPFHLMDCGTHS